METRIWNILGNHLKGESNQEEETILIEWLSENSENSKILEEVKDIWQKTGSLNSSRWSPEVDIDQEWEAFTKFRADNQESEKDKHAATMQEGNKHILFPAWAYRAAAAVVLGFGLIYYFNFTGGLQVNKEILVHSTLEEKTKILLPDSSAIWLNKQSEIAYDTDFGITHRTLSLSGEAFFDVRKDKAPFVIISGQTKTEVLGTAFNLRSYVEEGTTAVTLIHGSISFSEKEDPGNKVILAPGESAMLQKGSKILKSRHQDPNFMAWKEEVLVFNKSKLDGVIATLEKYFDITISVSNIQLYNCRFTGKFYNPNLDVILEVLSASLNIQHATENDSIVLKGSGCPPN